MSGEIRYPKKAVGDVPIPPAGRVHHFIDIADDIFKFKDENDDVFPVVPASALTAYVKQTVIDLTDSDNFSSILPTDVPGMSHTVTVDGDYVYFCLINFEQDQNEGNKLYYAKNGTTNLDEPVWGRFQKNEDESMQGTWSIDGLVIGDEITFQMTTSNDDINLRQRKIIAQSWG